MRGRGLSLREERLYEYGVNHIMRALLASCARTGNGWFHFNNGQMVLSVIPRRREP